MACLLHFFPHHFLFLHLYVSSGLFCWKIKRNLNFRIFFPPFLSVRLGTQPTTGSRDDRPVNLKENFPRKQKIRFLRRFYSGELETHTNRFTDISAIECSLIQQNSFRRLAVRGLQSQSIYSDVGQRKNSLSLPFSIR